MLIETERQGRVSVLRLHRPPVNAADLPFARAIHDAVVAARGDAATAAVVVTGIPGYFCAGVDTRAIPSYDADTRAEMLRTINRTILALYSCPKPVVAAVSGHALGAGLVLALTADVRLAARGEFKLGLTESVAGIPFPACPLVVIRAELAPDVLRVLAIGSASHRPESEVMRGVVDRVIAPEELVTEAVREADALAEHRGHAVVNRQIRASAIAEMERAVVHGDEPMFRGWV
jgi:enoyl-CoA hydratase